MTMFLDHPEFSVALEAPHGVYNTYVHVRLQYTQYSTEMFLLNLFFNVASISCL